MTKNVPIFDTRDYFLISEVPTGRAYVIIKHGKRTKIKSARIEVYEISRCDCCGVRYEVEIFGNTSNKLLYRTEKWG